ncbi:unnamed protein product [Cyclocybe aegerita]|uniref:Uncharacterized protein n=1 Tax=Cyclocybe aegerita TaxID=1973307 RepID=A0A8S0XNS2_CYCAE|nr:unnamed protein product [Cyclocybe aegerita]
MDDPLSPAIQRPGSLRSVPSNSSIRSGVSLSRRPRTRARSRTVTGAGSAPTSPLPPSPVPPSQSDLAYLNSPPDDLPLANPPVRPPRSPQRLDPPELRSSDTASSKEGTAADATVVEALPQASTDARLSKAAKIASNLPLLDTGYRSPPSAFQRDPALTPNVRDSVSTQRSGTSSSLYPPSTSTASGPESPPSPRSMALQDESIHDLSFGPEVNEVQEYDSDDVSYRLRLLVKNNYYLPPAHSKPSPAEFASTLPNAKSSAKTATPTFLDIFRVGRSKSKPTTPTSTTSPFDPKIPMLRTTSDSIAASYALRPQDPRSSSQMPRLSPHLPNPGSRGRVVVVREKMHDIAVAAKQAEQDLKTRGVRIDGGSQKAKLDALDDFIDPTDAVDVPLPSASYPFAVQASALHGLGVLESVGADVLADRLPPAKNPNMTVSYDPIEDTWRKAILHQAVQRSYDNTPDPSTFSHPIGASTPVGSPRPKGADSLKVDSPEDVRQLVEKRIIAQPMIDIIDRTTTPNHKRQKSGQSHASSSKGRAKGALGGGLVVDTSHDASRPHSYLPQRVETPSGPMTPLAPPPRRHFTNPLYSLSQTDLSSRPSHQPHSPHSYSDSESHSHPSLRRTVSSPMLSDEYESAISRHDLMSPPPMPHYSRHSQQTTTTSTNDTIRGSYQTPHESDNEEDVEEAGVGAPGRPSLSDYSQSSMSPTTSTFQEMLNHHHHRESSDEPHLQDLHLHQQHHSVVSSGNAGPSRFSIERQEALRDSPAPRYSTMSPPPRISSSLAHHALPPPPRSGFRRDLPPSSLSLSHSTSTSTPTPSPNPSTSTSASTSTRPRADSPDSAFQIVAPGPSTPPLPEPEPEPEPERGHRRSPSSTSASRLAALTIPSAVMDVPVAIHSAPGPISPTDFFDTIQTQHPNAMDDLDSSSDEEEEQGDMMPPQHQHQHPGRTSGVGQRPSFGGGMGSVGAAGVGGAGGVGGDARNRAVSSASTTNIRPTLMRHGNLSAPYIRSANANASAVDRSPVGNDAHSRLPVSNAPIRPHPATGGKDAPPSSFDFFRYAAGQEGRAYPGYASGSASVAAGGIGMFSGVHGGGGDGEVRRPSTADHVLEWRNSQKAQESLRRLDGMLIQHMEHEKDTIKRIATTLKQSAGS